MFMAPELYAEDCKYTKSVDMWALGVMYFHVLTGQYPYRCDSNPFQQLKALKKYKYKPLQGISNDSNQVLSRLLDIDPQKRITSFELKSHRIFKNYPYPPVKKAKKRKQKMQK